MKIISFDLQGLKIEVETESGLTLISAKDFENFLIRHNAISYTLEESESGKREPCRMSLEEYFQTDDRWIREDLENFLIVEDLRKAGNYEKQTEKFLQSIKHLINS